MIRRMFHSANSRIRSSGSGHRALDDICLDINKGEFFGIMGANGAGKSTLLRIISGAIFPTSGVVHVETPVRSLDLGTGLNPMLSGRQNLLAMGLAAGLSKNVLISLLDEIIDFSELRDVIDEPLSNYSTGMAMRLAFSLKIYTDANVLVIDESFAVGDARFVLKCTRRLKELCARGITIILASHDGHAIAELCDRALLIDKGRIAFAGDPVSTVDAYYGVLGIARQPEGGPSKIRHEFRELPPTIHSFMEFAVRHEGASFHHGDVHIIGARMFCNGLLSNGVFSHGDSCEIQWLIHARKPVEQLTSGIHIHSKTGAYVFGTSYVHLGRPLNIHEPAYLILAIRFNVLLGPGDYVVSIGVAEPDMKRHAVDGKQHDRFMSAFNICVSDFNPDSYEPIPFFGMINIPAEALSPVLVGADGP